MKREGNVLMGRDIPNRLRVGHMHSRGKDAFTEYVHVCGIVVINSRPAQYAR